MKQIILQIIPPIITCIMGYLTKLIPDKIRSRYPLGIRVDSKHSHIAGLFSGRMNRDVAVDIRIPIIFTNKTAVKFDTSLFEFSFNTKDEIGDLKFNITIMDQSGKSGSRFLIEPPEIKTHYLSVKIKSVFKDFGWEEFVSLLEGFENNPIILNFKYIVAIDSKEREFEEEIKDFFKNLINLIENF